MRIYSHVVTFDTGLAPNPFHGYCTSAVCTPSHMDAKLEDGDWLIGNSPVADGQRLIYAMRVSEVLIMDDYFRDRRYQRKKPKPNGEPHEQCGDNMYYQGFGGKWCRLPSHFHPSDEDMAHDVGHPVFVSRHFYYFGGKRVPIPEKLRNVIKERQGLKKKDGDLARAFVKWLETTYKPGVHGMPRDMRDHRKGSGTGTCHGPRPSPGGGGRGAARGRKC